MVRAPFPIGCRSGPLAPEQHLAVAVIKQAMLDVRHPHQHVRAQAAAFLAGKTPMLGFWADVAGVDATIIQRHGQGTG